MAIRNAPAGIRSMQHVTRPTADGKSLETIVVPDASKIKGSEVRRKLAYAVRCLLIKNYEDDREIGPIDFDWADEALMWIEWNTDRAQGEALMQGIALLTDIPDGCQP